MTRIVQIAGNSGSGKTTVSVNLAVALSKRGCDVVLVDANLYSPDIMHYIDAHPKGFLNEVIYNEKKIEDILTPHSSGARIIATMPEETHDQKKHSKINEALLSLIGKTELILVDTFSHNPLFFSIADSTDEILFVTNDDFPSIVKSKDFIQKLENNGFIVTGVILNRKNKSSNRKHIEAILDKKILAHIPYDEKIVHALNLRKPAVIHYPFSKAVKELRELALLLDIYAKK
jgi:MinD-like ATPase involved in chromosome partitioning or flagellar assembly